MFRPLMESADRRNALSLNTCPNQRLRLWGFTLLCFLLAGSSFASISTRVVVWGGFDWHRNVPQDLTNAVAIDAGDYLSFALREDGSVISWPSDLTPPFWTNVVAIDAQGDWLALRSDGTLSSYMAPLRFSNVVAIAGGEFHNLMLNADGTLTSWGTANWGTTNIPCDATNIVAIAVGRKHSVALRDSGTVLAWGGAFLPTTDVPPGLSNVVAIAGGTDYSLALQSDGTLATWGVGPVLPLGLSNVVSIAAGDRHSLALKSDGTVVAWGDDTFGQADVPQDLTNVLAISCGDYQSEALVGESPPVVPPMPDLVAYSGNAALFKANVVGTFPLSYQWQFNGTNIPGAIMPWFMVTNVQSGTTGIYTVMVTNALGSAFRSATLAVTNTPPIVLEHPGDVAVPLHNNPAFRVRATGSLPHTYQWLFNETNAIAGATNSILTLRNAQLPSAGFYSVAVSNAFGTTLSSNASLSFVKSSVVAWGANNQGESTVPPGLTDVKAIAAGYDLSMALKTDGTLVVWGNVMFTNIPANLSNVVSIAGGNCFGAAVKDEGSVAVWGAEVYGWIPTNVPPDLTNAITIAAGERHCLALTKAGTVVAWGSDDEGECDVPAGLSNVTAVAAGSAASAALRAGGTVYGWGRWSGLLNPLTNIIAIASCHRSTSLLALRAEGTVVQLGGALPPEGLTNVVEIALGADHSLARTADGTVVAWGYGWYGQNAVPPGLTNVMAIAAGTYHCLALDPAGGVVKLQSAEGAGQVAYVQVHVGPPAALAAGAGWSIFGRPVYSSSPNFTIFVTNKQDLTLLFQPVEGWAVPRDDTLAVTLGALTRLNVSYSVAPPSLLLHTSLGLGITGTTGTVYRLERKSSLTNGDWLPVSTNQILLRGFNPLLVNPPASEPEIFYRALWLPE
jgi:alpha-tubulin suppressor-like RCC1 family protein